MTRLHTVPPRLEARFAGILYLLNLLTGVAAMVLISRKLQAQGDVVNRVAALLYTGVTLLLWDIFRPVSASLSTIAAVTSLLGCWFPLSRFVHLSNFLFFGIYCLLLGVLILRSWFMPRAVGILVACAGVAWLATLHPTFPQTMVLATAVGLFGEGSLIVYLLTKGLDQQQWQAQAQAVVLR